MARWISNFLSIEEGEIIIKEEEEEEKIYKEFEVFNTNVSSLPPSNIMQEEDCEMLLSSVRAFVMEQAERFSQPPLYIAKMIIVTILEDIN